jgi:bifunctional DNA-binding transcriptional regulator/antitoxin component of YhaV-PrlF toxin-antitoxin module
MLSSEGTSAFTIMTVTVKNRIGLTVPEAVQRRAGIKIGDRLEFRVSGGIINIIPKLPTADDEYTPAQRKILNAQLAEDLADIKAGRTAGPFNSADEMIAHMKTELKKRAAKKLKHSR